jgi:hypothetical protein
MRKAGALAITALVLSSMVIAIDIPAARTRP